MQNLQCTTGPNGYANKIPITRYVYHMKRITGNDFLKAKDTFFPKQRIIRNGDDQTLLKGIKTTFMGKRGQGHSARIECYLGRENKTNENKVLASNELSTCMCIYLRVSTEAETINILHYVKLTGQQLFTIQFPNSGLPYRTQVVSPWYQTPHKVYICSYGTAIVITLLSILRNQLAMKIR